MLMRDRTGTIPKRTGPDRFLFTQVRFGTGPERIQMDPKLDQQKSRSSFGSVWIHFGPVPKWSCVNRRPIRFDFGPDPFGTGLM